MAVVNPTGHSAIYLDHVCAETPVHLRPCQPGELGAVISRYNDIRGYDWIAIPLLPYLYSVDRPEEIPGSVDLLAVARLRNAYRRTHLRAIAPDDAEGNAPAGNWYELVGSAYDRTLYGFQVNSTPEQDARLMELLNDRRNVQRYNGAFRNCADFTRVTLNRFYPHAVRRNFIADLGLTTPKSVARGLNHYAAKHPEVHLQAFVIPQVKGSLPRSRKAQGVSESLVKKYGVPLTLISPVATGAMFIAYLGHGRFDMPRNAPVLDLSDANTRPEVVVNTSHFFGLESKDEMVTSGTVAVSIQRPAAGADQLGLEEPAAAGPVLGTPVSAIASENLFNVPTLVLPVFP